MLVELHSFVRPNRLAVALDYAVGQPDFDWQLQDSPLPVAVRVGLALSL